ncbi:MAG: hypothetical protein D5R96_03590 [Methanocalculus sp. MSAO_Arc2]|nr:MAG: hypothetical protein D5R96_03590 [Methanocalculus sp. MSAO_Arc2]
MTGFFMMVCDGGNPPARLEHHLRITNPDDAIGILKEWYRDKPQEAVCTITLDGAHQVIAIRLVTIGLVNQSQIHPREIFRGAVADNACSVMIAHNHPSGNLAPSSDDIAVAKKLQEAGEILGIRLLDSLIISGDDFKSMHGEGYF